MGEIYIIYSCTICYIYKYIYIDMNQCYLCEFKSNKKSDPKGVGVTVSLSCESVFVFDTSTITSIY